MHPNSPMKLTCGLICAVAWLGLCLFVGCGGSRYYKVKPDVAQRTLIQVLDQWKSGATPKSLRSAKPEIVVQDFEWANGAKLVAYEVLADAEARDANLIVKVKLTLKDAQDKETAKVATYLVGTAPVLTVFRDMFN